MVSHFAPLRPTAPLVRRERWHSWPCERVDLPVVRDPHFAAREVFPLCESGTCGVRLEDRRSSGTTRVETVGRFHASNRYFKIPEAGGHRVLTNARFRDRKPVSRVGWQIQ